MTDLQLITGLRNKDDGCLRYLYKHYLPDVRKYVLNNSGDEDDAKDQFQDAIIALIENLRNNKYENKNILKGYFLRIVRNKWLDKLDKDKRRTSYESGEEAQEDNPFEIFKPRISLGKYLREALEKLGEPCKGLLLATVCMKMKMEQAAKAFGYADAHSARQQKLQCLKKLKLLVDTGLLMDLI